MHVQGVREGECDLYRREARHQVARPSAKTTARESAGSLWAKTTPGPLPENKEGAVLWKERKERFHTASAMRSQLPGAHKMEDLAACGQGGLPTSDSKDWLLSVER